MVDDAAIIQERLPFPERQSDNCRSNEPVRDVVTRGAVIARPAALVHQREIAASSAYRTVFVERF
jgi:hypothetical protein